MARVRVRSGALTVYGPTGNGYPVPDMAAIDEHLSRLTRSRHAASLYPAGVAVLSGDIDALLDCRKAMEDA